MRKKVKGEKLRSLILSSLRIQKQITSRGIYLRAQIEFSQKNAGYSSGEVTNMFTRLKREGLIQPVGKMKDGIVYVTIWGLKQNGEAKLST